MATFDTDISKKDFEAISSNDDIINHRAAILKYCFYSERLIRKHLLSVINGDDYLLYTMGEYTDFSNKDLIEFFNKVKVTEDSKWCDVINHSTFSKLLLIVTNLKFTYSNKFFDTFNRSICGNENQVTKKYKNQTIISIFYEIRRIRNVCAHQDLETVSHIFQGSRHIPHLDKKYIGINLHAKVFEILETRFSISAIDTKKVLSISE